MKITRRLKGSGINAHLLSCDLCDATEVSNLLNPDGPADGALLAMFAGVEDGAKYTVCANCANLEAGKGKVAAMV